MLAAVHCKDKFGNVARRHDKISFGLALLAQDHNNKEDAKKDSASSAAASVPSMKFDGIWLDGEQYQMNYMGQSAGDFELHVWCHPDGTEARKWLQGSPFPVRVLGVRASPAGSFLGGRQDCNDAEQQQDVPESNSQIASNSPTQASASKRRSQRLPKLGAGERLVLRPQLRDEYGNASFASENALVASMESPEGEVDLPVKQLSGLGRYEIAYEVQVKGVHSVHVRLDGENITGSPFTFMATPGQPVAHKSRIIKPNNASIVNTPCIITLEAVDVFGNPIDVGGATVVARALGTGVSGCDVADNEDGTYHVTFTSTVVGECRVIVRLDNKEMNPVTVQFEKEKEGTEVGAEAEAAPASANAAELGAELLAALVVSATHAGASSAGASAPAPASQ